MQLFTALLSVLALASSTTASPVERSDLIVVTPAITSPTKGSTWKIASNQFVKWDTSRIPPSASNQTGTILLGFYNGTRSENLDVDHPLAQGFKLTTGSQVVTVPNVPHRTTYFVVLVGDSGDSSPEFTISQ
ncbi:hypothetical protein F5148DRAFT_1197422 [Russula earlei]|uniref:Uncharacterized protein n=1 Tax=Russula earlei TaxID=71964 RepID=A0ACC0UAS3_9AGAM|nr:hypothetical protein F5148DRAFT_1197422 [Russula earlei]